MARLIAAFALAMIAACGAGRDRGPAWPTRSEPETDGGESLAPRTASVVAASEETKEAAKTEEKTETKTEVKEADKPAATTEAAKATTTTTTTDDVIIIDDIVIEIED